ncbi:hypothetical protein [Synechococcus sp. 1G10]|uniref:hypothetical protein n=1 Tax=Synechococcus sp. 1G10 TaxID=2025605 RepID=UPI000B99466D|nr:hypothetical protein [Synechococcus sp. 1G10]
MEINHPGARQLSEKEQALLAQFRAQLKERIATTGLTAEDVRLIVQGMRNHPDVSNEAVQILREEASSLMPGQRLVTFDWD